MVTSTKSPKSSGASTRFVADCAGQAMAEYAIIVAAVVTAIAGVGFVFLPEFINALQRYYDGYYIMLNLPIP